MKIRLKLNIGTEDKKRLGLDGPALEGDVVNVGRKTADVLLAKGWGESPDRPADAPAEDDADDEGEDAPSGRRTPGPGKAPPVGAGGSTPVTAKK